MLRNDRLFYSPEDRDFHLIRDDQTETEIPTGWHLIPETVSIVWHDDQASNEIRLDAEGDYPFDPQADLALLQQYEDQLFDMLR